MTSPRGIKKRLHDCLSIERLRIRMESELAGAGPLIVSWVLADTGATQVKLAEVMGITNVHLNNIKQGRGEMSIKFAVKLWNAHAILKEG